MSASATERASLSYHKNIICDNCLKEDFQEKRYKCLRCFSYDLCESCFKEKASNKKHSTSHPMVALLTKKEYEAKSDLMLKLLNDLSYGDYDDFCYDIPEIFAEQNSTGLSLMILSVRRTSNSEENEQSRDSIKPEHGEEGPLKLAQDFEKLFQEEIGCDVTFKVKGMIMKAHKAVLMARSIAFLKMFQHDTAEAKSNTVTITDFEPEPFRTFLGYLYYAKVDNILLRRQVSALYGLADKYFVKELKEMCLEWMKGNIDDDNFCEIIWLAVTHGDLDLLGRTKEYFIKNMKNIIVTQKWRDFIRENPDEANELFIAASNKNC